MFEPSPKVRDLKARLEAFMDAHIYPNEDRYLREVEAGNQIARLELRRHRDNADAGHPAAVAARATVVRR